MPKKAEKEIRSWTFSPNRVAVKLFAKRLRGKEYTKLRESLRQARMIAIPEEHVSIAIFYTMIFAAVGALSGSLIAWLIGIPWFYLAILFTFAFGFGFYQIYMNYPSLVAKGRVQQIDMMLPSTSTFMYAMARGGVGIVENFRQISQQREEYGEISREAVEVVRNVEYLGMSPPEAIKDVAMTTPSAKLRSFLNLLVPIVETSAADVSEYFGRKSKQFYEEARIQQKSYLESLGMIAEIYVIMLGLGPLLGIVALIMMSMAGAFYIEFLYFIIYLLIPVGTLMFLVMLSAIQRIPTEERGLASGPRREIFKAETPEEKKIAAKILRGRLGWFRTIARGPIGYFRRRPLDIFVITLPLTLVFLALVFLQGSFDTGTLILAVLLATTPFVIFYEIRSRWAGKLIDALPDFLTGLSGSVASGLTLRQSFDTMSGAELGALTEEVKKMQSDVSWGRSTIEALTKFQERIRIGIVTRISILIKKASEARGYISDVLDIIAGDVGMTRTLRQERRASMSAYVIIVYMSFGLFLIMAYVFASSFLPLLSARPMAQAPVVGELMGTYTVDPQLLKMLFFHGSLIHGVCSGLVAGQMGSGSVLAGVKHSLVMVTVAYLLFTVFAI